MTLNKITKRSIIGLICCLLCCLVFFSYKKLKTKPLFIRIFSYTMYEAAKNNDIAFIEKNIKNTKSLYQRGEYLEGPVAHLFANLTTNHTLSKRKNLLNTDRTSYAAVVDLIKKIKIPNSNENFFDLSQKQDQLVESIKKIYISEENYLGYNPSAVIMDNKIIVAFRLDDMSESSQNSFIVMAELDLNFQLLSKPQKLVIGLCSKVKCRAEDPRLFMLNNKLHVVFNNDIEMLSKDISNNREMRLASITKNKDGEYVAENVIRLISPFNKQAEKNWAPFIFKNQLYLVYSISPEFILLKPNLNTGYSEVVFTKPNEQNLQFGELRNTSNYTEMKNGEFIGFLHTHFPLNNHWYYFTFIAKIDCQEKVETCAINRILESPFLFKYAPFNQTYNNMYFSSLIKSNDDLIAFSGINDSEMNLVKLNANNLLTIFKENK